MGVAVITGAGSGLGVGVEAYRSGPAGAPARSAIARDQTLAEAGRPAAAAGRSGFPAADFPIDKRL